MNVIKCVNRSIARRRFSEGSLHKQKHAHIYTQTPKSTITILVQPPFSLQSLCESELGPSTHALRPITDVHENCILINTDLWYIY